MTSLEIIGRHAEPPRTSGYGMSLFSAASAIASYSDRRLGSGPEGRVPTLRLTGSRDKRSNKHDTSTR
jgi:hypothetical protein